MISLPLEELVPVDVIRIFVGIDDSLGHRGPDLAEELDHLLGVGEVGLGVDDHATADVDQARVGIADPVLLVQHGVTVVADLLHLHAGDLLDARPSAPLGGFVKSTLKSLRD